MQMQPPSVQLNDIDRLLDGFPERKDHLSDQIFHHPPSNKPLKAYKSGDST
jgi:hypothetical protein